MNNQSLHSEIIINLIAKSQGMGTFLPNLARVLKWFLGIIIIIKNRSVAKIYTGRKQTGAKSFPKFGIRNFD